MTLSGFPSIVWNEGKPLGVRRAIIIAGKRYCAILNQPYNDPRYPGGEAEVDLAWETLTPSLVFFDVWY